MTNDHFCEICDSPVDVVEVTTIKYQSKYQDLLVKHERVLEMLRISEQALKDAEFIFEGSVAIDGQSDEILDKRSRAVERFLKALEEVERLKNDNSGTK